MTRTTLLVLAQVALPLYVSTLPGTVEAQTKANPNLGRIILIEPKATKGALKITQAKGVDPVNAREGMLVRRGYLLTLGRAAKATVMCGDGKRRELMPGPQGCPCTTPCTPAICGIHYDGSTIGATRGPDTDRSTYPVVISPRKTMLRNLRPMIRWSPIVGAKQSATYRVTLYGEGGKAIWSKEISGETRLNYPDAEPPLMPGQTYKVVVASEGMTSEEDHTPGLGFTTLTIEEARALADKESKTTELALPENQTRFLVANLYAAKEQFAEAIELLEKLSSEMKEPAVAVILGDLYAVIGLSREAEKEYLLALTLMDANDFDGHGMTQRSLAQVYETLGNIDEALARLRQAITAYRRLKLRTIINSLLTKERRLKRQQAQELNRSRHNRSAQ